ncbi:MAG: hypothetical protein C0506_13265 [Anaerolinea sp.]|nr:hypothetical protein [Anaerolinea sp.]
MVVGALAGGVLLFQAGSSERPPAASPEPAATNEPAASAYKPEASVCQGLLHRPDAKSERKLPDVYTKRVEAAGITIAGNQDVSDAAMAQAAKTVERIFKNNDLEQRLAEEGAYIIVAASGQGVLDLPEFACLGQQTRIDFDHVCGVADRADYPVATVNELDLLGDKKGPCTGLNILYHEVGHLVQGWTISPADYFDVRRFYQQAIDSGVYRRGADYATTNANEYFAESTQSYFLSQSSNGGRDRAWLQRNDPDMFSLLASIYGD